MTRTTHAKQSAGDSLPCFRQYDVRLYEDDSGPNTWRVGWVETVPGDLPVTAPRPTTVTWGVSGITNTPFVTITLDVADGQDPIDDATELFQERFADPIRVYRNGKTVRS